MTTVPEFYGNAHIGLRFGVKNANHTSPIGHSGQDVNGWATGTWIPAFAAGRVVNKVADGGQHNVNDLGNFIVIQANIGGVTYFISYCHLASFGGTPNIGDWVQFGQGVGPIGNTGYSFGTHLHAMMSTTSPYPYTRVNLVDPLPFIYAARNAAAGGDVTPIPPTPPAQYSKPRPEMDTKMSKAKYYQSVPIIPVGGGAAVAHYGIFGNEVQGGYRISTNIITGKAWGKLYGTEFIDLNANPGAAGYERDSWLGAPWEILDEVTWNILKNEAAAARSDLESLYAGGDEFSVQQKFDISQAATAGAQLTIDGISEKIDETSYDISLSIDSVPTTNATGTATPA